MPAQSQVGRIELQDVPRVDNSFILSRHRIRQSHKIAFMIGVIFIRLEQSYDTGGRRSKKSLCRSVCTQGRLEVGDIPVQQLVILYLYFTDTARAFITGRAA